MEIRHGEKLEEERKPRGDYARRERRKTNVLEKRMKS